MSDRWSNTSGAGGVSYQYQWLRSDNSGGSWTPLTAYSASSTYSVTSGDYQKWLKVVVTASAAGYADATSGSNPVQVSAGSFTAANFMFQAAPKDGTALHLLMPGMALLQALGAPNAKYDAGKLAYVGNLSRAPQILMTWWVTGFKTIDDGRRREMALGAIGVRA